MKRIVLTAMLILVMALSGCKTAADASKNVLKQYQQKIEAVVQISALSGVSCDYQLSCVVELTESTVNIVEPESLKGLKATIDSNTCKIHYEDLILDSLMIPIRGMTPMDCFDQTINSLRCEVPESYGYEKRNEKESLCLTYRGESSGYECTKIIWLEEESLEILEGEYYLDGVLIMRMFVESIRFTDTPIAE